MKYKFLTLLAFLPLLAFSQSKGTGKNRYFEVYFYGQDERGVLSYGNQTISTTNGYYPTQSEIKNLIIEGQKLNFPKDSKRLLVWMTEFKNKEESDKWHEENSGEKRD